MDVMDVMDIMDVLDVDVMDMDIMDIKNAMDMEGVVVDVMYGMDIRVCWEWQSKDIQKPTSIFCCHLVYRLGINCKKLAPKSFSGQEIDPKMGPDH